MTDTTFAPLSEEEARRLDAAENPLLAPVRGRDVRGKLAKTYFVKKPARFVAKFLFATAVIAGGWAVLATQDNWAVRIVAIIVLGLIYAHLVELQHETLHEYAFHSRRLNRLTGFLSGLWMFSSFWHYKYDHLRHHAFLGTPRNREFFNYRFRNLDSPLGFLIATMHLGRYPDVLRTLARACLGRRLPGVERKLDERKIVAEYRWFAVIIAVTIGISVATGSWLAVWAWLIPTLLVAEGAHFLIEMPEHFGLNTQTDDNVLTNTRTIKAGRLAQWYTNFNNLHTAHHWHQGVPIANAKALHAQIDGNIGTVEKSYFDFYRKVIRGDIRYTRMEDNCMDR